MKIILSFFLMPPLCLTAQEFDLMEFFKTNYGKVNDSVLTELAFDSLVDEASQDSESRLLWTTRKFQQSDDNQLRVFHFTGESCGAYCNPFYQSVISIGDSNLFEETEEIEFDIERVVTLQSGDLYLLFGTHSGRPRGVEAVWGETAVLCSIDSGFKVIWSLKSTTSSSVDLESPMSEISYNSNTQSISYSYDWYDEFNDFKVYRMSGTWKFNGKEFEEEARHFIRLDSVLTKD